MANENKDVLRVEDASTSIVSTLRERQLGFATNTYSLYFKASGGIGYEYAAQGYAADYSNVTIDDYIIHDGDSDTKIGFPTADKFNITCGNLSFVDFTEDTTDSIEFNPGESDVNFEINSVLGSSFWLDGGTGNVCFGSSPVAAANQSGQTYLQVGGNGALYSTTAAAAGNSIYLLQNLYESGSAWRYISTDEAGFLRLDNGALTFRNFPSGTAGSAASGITTRFSVDASGVGYFADEVTVEDGFLLRYDSGSGYGILSPNSVSNFSRVQFEIAHYDGTKAVRGQLYTLGGETTGSINLKLTDPSSADFTISQASGNATFENSGYFRFNSDVGINRAPTNYPLEVNGHIQWFDSADTDHSSLLSHSTTALGASTCCIQSDDGTNGIGTGNIVIGKASSLTNSLALQNKGLSSGVIASLGTSSPEAWTTNLAAFQLGYTGSIYSSVTTSNGINVMVNLYDDGSLKRIVADGTAWMFLTDTTWGVYFGDSGSADASPTQQLALSLTTTAFTIGTVGDNVDVTINGDTALKGDIDHDGTNVGFYSVTPVAQPSSTGETTGFTAGSGTGVNDDSTFTGNVGSTAYRISDIVKHLKNLGLLAS